MRFLLETRIDGNERICEFKIPLKEIIAILNQHKNKNEDASRLMATVTIRQYDETYQERYLQYPQNPRRWVEDNGISKVLLETYNKKPVKKYFGYYLYNITKEMHLHLLLLG